MSLQGNICNCWCYQIKKVSVASLNSFIKDSRSNSLVVRALDCESTSRGFKITRWLKVDSTCDHFEVDEMCIRISWRLSD